MFGAGRAHSTPSAPGRVRRVACSDQTLARQVLLFGRAGVLEESDGLEVLAKLLPFIRG
jgi:hypothetical protein